MLQSPKTCQRPVPNPIRILLSSGEASGDLYASELLRELRRRRIAFWSHTLSERNYRDVWTVPADGGEIVPVTRDEYADWNPVWSPDRVPVSLE
jgi:hypothetical protein